MKTFTQYLISFIIFIILIFGSDGCSNNPSSPSGSNGTSSDSLFFQADSLYAHGVPGFLSHYDTISPCNFKSVRVTFNASTNDTSNNSTSASLSISFIIIHEPINIGNDIVFTGRNMNINCDTVINISDTITHNLKFGYAISARNIPFVDTTRWVRVNSLKIYKHD